MRCGQVPSPLRGEGEDEGVRGDEVRMRVFEGMRMRKLPSFPRRQEPRIPAPNPARA